MEWLKVQSSLLHEETFILLEYDTATPLFCLTMDILCLMQLFFCMFRRMSVKFLIPISMLLYSNLQENFIVLNSSNISDHCPVIVKSNFDPSNKKMLFCAKPTNYRH